MKCFNCDCEYDACTFGESYDCDHCGDSNLIEYNTCRECKISWKSINGKVIENSVFTEEELKGMFEGNMDDFIDKMIDRTLCNRNTMSGMIHRCLRCDSISYEVSGNGRFKCSNKDCGFEWEVIDCG